MSIFSIKKKGEIKERKKKRAGNPVVFVPGLQYPVCQTLCSLRVILCSKCEQFPRIPRRRLLYHLAWSLGRYLKGWEKRNGLCQDHQVHASGTWRSTPFLLRQEQVVWDFTPKADATVGRKGLVCVKDMIVSSMHCTKKRKHWPMISVDLCCIVHKTSQSAAGNTDVNSVSVLQWAVIMLVIIMVKTMTQ